MDRLGKDLDVLAFVLQYHFGTKLASLLPEKTENALMTLPGENMFAEVVSEVVSGGEDTTDVMAAFEVCEAASMSSISFEAKSFNGSMRATCLANSSWASSFGCRSWRV